MLILFTGGSGCGKSSYAEDVCARLADGTPLYYIAAMKPFGEGSAEKIGRHRRMRAEKGFTTIERYTDLAGLTLPSDGGRKPIALLECIANLTANEMFDDAGNARDPYEPVIAGVRTLAAQCSTLVVVTNDVGSDGGGYGELTEEYVRVIGKINAVLAAEADAVCEMLYGCPKMIKGSLPFYRAEEKDKKHMLLIVGAEGSGKRTYAETLGYPAEALLNAETCIGAALPDGLDAQVRGIYHAEALVKGIAARDARTVSKADMNERVNEIEAQLTGYEVILANEVGNGVIPLEPEVRREREAAGRLTTLLARRAGTVVRMVCGIPVVLKGELPRPKPSEDQ